MFAVRSISNPGENGIYAVISSDYTYLYIESMQYQYACAMILMLDEEGNCVGCGGCHPTSVCKVRSLLGLPVYS